MAGYDGDWQERQGGWRGRGRDAPRQGWGQGSGTGERGYRWPGGSSQPWASRPPRGMSEWWRREGSGYRSGTGYDFGYQGGEFGRAVNARDWGTRGSYGTPDRRPSSGWSGDWRGAYRGDEYNAGYGRDYEYEDTRRGSGRPWDYRRDYGDDFGGRLRRDYGRTPADRWPADAPSRANARMSDDDVLESVRENLFQDTYIDHDRVEVEVEGGIVTLRGEVDDFLEARYAWDDAWESPGVRGVINHLTVRTDRASEEMDMPQTRHEGGGE